MPIDAPHRPQVLRLFVAASLVPDAKRTSGYKRYSRQTVVDSGFVVGRVRERDADGRCRGELSVLNFGPTRTEDPSGPASNAPPVRLFKYETTFPRRGPFVRLSDTTAVLRRPRHVSSSRRLMRRLPIERQRVNRIWFRHGTAAHKIAFELQGTDPACRERQLRQRSRHRPCMPHRQVKPLGRGCDARWRALVSVWGSARIAIRPRRSTPNR
jgi:hypothetical protein